MSDAELTALLLWLAVLLASQHGSRWRQLLATPLYQHLLLSAALALLPLWWLRAGLHAGLEVHFLGLTALTLLLGWRLALVAGSLALLTLTACGSEPWPLLGSHALLGVLLPVLTTELLFLASWAWLARHLFVYLFVVAFLGGAAAISVKLLATALWMGMSGAYPWQIIADDYLAIWPLLLFPEALLNGMTMTLLAVYRPHWVYSFHDHVYLGPPRP
ncbi:energy-coupling factor ABC transporter permease [Aeromonas simiae]|uniref:energy-coupling factor ABC transporter permease n=1 Tax=Aeromonas simiae TaxID=218936 RepID=UPI00266BE712|nr:energy-coupling factor ABC transporter permease [Aeromonas simiae]MDO2946823.1 energy-coupling factor ABC transporter permease [Aeromonas simiae]MDO2951376.1 energy-coupling factor ABC transporter permease [Aeromonas simiae]MDO2954583.1 energy-coupling factor ABC transporter permease [Aeromonas simiae]